MKLLSCKNWLSCHYNKVGVTTSMADNERCSFVSLWNPKGNSLKKKNGSRIPLKVCPLTILNDLGRWDTIGRTKSSLIRVVSIAYNSGIWMSMSRAMWPWMSHYVFMGLELFIWIMKRILHVLYLAFDWNSIPWFQ